MANKSISRGNRKSIRLKEFDYSEGNWFFVTICTHQRKYLFGEIANGKMIFNQFGYLAKKEWVNTKNLRDNIELDYYVIMPNHMHGIIIITHRSELCRGVLQYAPTNEFRSPSQSLGAVIRGFKGTVTKQINGLRGTPGNPVWRRNYYERVIKNDRELYNIRNYILNNPVKWDFEKNIPENLELC